MIAITTSNSMSVKAGILRWFGTVRSLTQDRSKTPYEWLTQSRFSAKYVPMAPE